MTVFSEEKRLYLAAANEIEQLHNLLSAPDSREKVVKILSMVKVESIFESEEEKQQYFASVRAIEQAYNYLHAPDTRELFIIQLAAKLRK